MFFTPSIPTLVGLLAALLLICETIVIAQGDPLLNILLPIIKALIAAVCGRITGLDIL